jgi:hypothetical protein
MARMCRHVEQMPLSLHRQLRTRGHLSRQDPFQDVEFLPPSHLRGVHDGPHLTKVNMPLEAHAQLLFSGSSSQIKAVLVFTHHSTNKFLKVKVKLHALLTVIVDGGE